MKNTRILTYEEQCLWLRALGKVLFEGNYTVLQDSIVITTGPDPGYFGISFRTISDVPIIYQTRKEFNDAVKLGMLEDK